MKTLLIRARLALASLTLLSVILLSGCSAIDVNDYRNTTPALDLKTFFDGKLKDEPYDEAMLAKSLEGLPDVAAQ